VVSNFVTMNAEGWYVDPFGHHEARWMSGGTPTSLVRDGGVESQDPPPSMAFQGELERVQESTSHDGADLKRADDAEQEEFDPNAIIQAASDAIDSTNGF
jgi:hypothetical protein